MSRFPLSDHCDGTHFHNPVVGAVAARPAAARGLLPILRWRLGGTRARWPERITDPAPRGDPHALPGSDEAAVTFIGHASWLICMGGLTMLADPIFSERCSPVGWAGPRRVRAPGRTLAELPRIDLVLISHNHYDHLDLPSLRLIVARDRPAFVTPLGNARHLAKAGIRPDAVFELDWWQAHRFRDTTITATPARHFSARTPFDARTALWSGFMIAQEAAQETQRLLFAGDSGDGPHWGEIAAHLGSPGVALLPIGAYDPPGLMAPVHMNPEEAVAAHQALGAERSVGMHFGTFQLTDEAIDEPPRRLAAAVARAGLAPDRFVTLDPGETRRLSTRLGPQDTAA